MVLRKALAPIVVTLDGIRIEVRLFAESNALSAMVANALPDSNVTAASAVASENASSSIVLTLAGILIEVSEVAA